MPVSAARVAKIGCHVGDLPPAQYAVAGDAVVARVSPAEQHQVRGRRAVHQPGGRRRQLHPRLVGVRAPLPAAYGPHPVGVPLTGPGGGGVGVGGGCIARVRHQGGQFTTILGAEHLVARYRTGVLHGGLPAQEYPSNAEAGDQSGGGRRRRSRQLNHHRVRGLAPFPSRTAFTL